jgi:amidase
MPDEILHLDATAQAELVRKGEVSPSELVDAAIAAAERLNPTLNAIVHERYEDARADAASPDLPDGPFRGVPFVEKDLDGYAAGQPFHGGMRHLAELDHRPTEDSELHRRFVQAGFVTIGRTNTPELGLQPTTEPLAKGPAHNPWDTARSPGGSSGGSAAAVAARIVAAGHAGDGGGSIRIPASACGLVGLKPSRGRTSLGPHVGEAWGGAVVRLAVTRSVRDTAAILDAVAGGAPGDPYVAPPPARPFRDEVGADPGSLRVGVSTVAHDPTVVVHPAVQAVIDDVEVLLADLGHDVERAHPAVWDDPEAGAELVAQFTNAYAAWVANELAELGHASGREIAEDGVEPSTWMLAELGRAVTAVQYQTALTALSRSARALASWWAEGHDLLVTPVFGEPPFELGQFAGTPENPLAGLVRSTEIVPFTLPFNVSGQPAISVPVGWTDDGLPVGVQLVAAYGREDLLLQVASQLEQARPWADRLPPVHA